LFRIKYSARRLFVLLIIILYNFTYPYSHTLKPYSIAFSALNVLQENIEAPEEVFTSEKEEEKAVNQVTLYMIV